MNHTAITFSLFLYLLCFLCLWGCASWSSQEKKEKAQMQAQVGMSLLESGNYPEALSALLHAYELEPEDPTILNNLGLAYFYRGKPEKAKFYLQKALKQNYQFTDAHNNLGRILLELGEYKASEIHLKKAVEDLTYPKPEKPYLNLGLLYFKTNRYQEAKKASEKSVYYDKRSCASNTLLGRSYYQIQEYFLSASILDKAIGYCPFQSADEAQFWSGMSYLKLGDIDKTKSRFNEIVKLYPESPYRTQAQKELSQERLNR
jgi:type IV pilus assembly protein PilF